MPVRPSARLQEGGIEHCLLGLSPESESKVLARQELALKQGVRFASSGAATTESLVMRTRTGTVRRVMATHDRQKLHRINADLY